ncbi:hypothetical protein [Photorhabdus temperata]|uniref:hypothetical protein n=1 Tax=Photorhabdus temperata TaxID=574560 RepID=UPI000426B728
MLNSRNLIYDDLNQLHELLKRQDIDGVQIVYNWKQLESAPGEYDFSAIEKDLMLLNKIQKKLFIQIQDRFFKKDARYIPFYLQQNSKYQGDLVTQLDNPGENKEQSYGWLLFTCEWNNDHQYMSRLFNFASKNKIGLGSPDIVPYQSAQMKNAYPFFNRYKGKLDLWIWLRWQSRNQL